MGIDTDAIIKIVGGVVATVIAAIFGRSFVIRRVSKDKVMVAQDGAGVDIIGVLRQERDTLVGRLDLLTTQRDEAMREHSKAMLEIGGLRAQVEHLTDRLADQSRTLLEQAVKIESLQKTVDALRAHIQSLVGLREVGQPLRPEDDSP